MPYFDSWRKSFHCGLIPLRGQAPLDQLDLPRPRHRMDCTRDLRIALPLEVASFRTTFDPPELPRLHNTVTEECDGPHQPARKSREQRVDALDRARRGHRFFRSTRWPLRADPSAD